MVQYEKEGIDPFVVRSRTQAIKFGYKIPSVTRHFTRERNDICTICGTIEFRDLTNDLIRDKIVVELRNQNTRSELLREKS